MLNHLSETEIRLLVFAAVLCAMGLLELAMPKRRLAPRKQRRWLTNLGMGGLGAALVRLMGFVATPLIAVGAAIWAEGHHFGIFNWLHWPLVAVAIITLLALDLAIWFQHWASHRVLLLWRLHQVHHADRDVDVTTALRFHPVEIALSMIYKVAWVLVLGASPGVVVLFEVILNGCAIFNHANVDLPQWLDRGLRLLVVTPDMHRIHHSVARYEHDTNFGFNLSIWDRLFGTYTAQPEKGHRDMVIGLSAYQIDAPARLGWSLLLPLKDSPNRDRDISE